MEGVFRRGGVCYARLVVPVRLRAAIGKTEFVASAGLREAVSARVLAGEYVAAWRRELFEAQRLFNFSMPIDYERLLLPDPSLRSGGYFSLKTAAELSGFDVPTLLRESEAGRLNLFYRANGVEGCEIALASLIAAHRLPDGTLEVPPTEHMPEGAIERIYNGMLSIRPEGVKYVAASLLVGEEFDALLFLLAKNPLVAFAS